MLINDKDALARLNAPGNLINRLRGDKKNNAMSLFGMNKKAEQKVELIKKDFNPFSQAKPVEEPTEIEDSPSQEPNLDSILDDHQSKIKLSLAHDKALELLTSSVTKLTAELDNVKPDKLPSVIAAASKTVESIRRERNEAAKNNKGQDVHFHFYTPSQRKLESYEVIEVPA